MTFRLASLIFILSILLSDAPVVAVGNPGGKPFVVNDCPTACAWFGKEPGYKATLMSVGAGPQAYAKLSAPDTINVAFAQAQHYYTTFGRGCVGGFYDASHRIAALYAWHENYDDTAVFFVQRPVSGFTPATLRSIRTARGVGLGATMERVEAIEGVGTRLSSAGGAQVVRYQWHQAMRGTGLTATLYLTFLFERDRLVAIDLGKRL